MRDLVTLDFETDKIEPRPHFPPRPVGLAVKYGAGPSKYLSFGHPVGNTSTKKAAAKVLVDAWNSDAELLFHNAKFDLSICYEYFNLPELPWERIHDTMFLAFLADPHSRAIDLKGLAEDLLGQPPDERSALSEWIWDNRKALTGKYGGSIGREKGLPQATKKSTGEWLSRAPAEIVAPYAEGDTDRTYDLFQHLYALILENGMLEAYNRERQILPIFMENERLGIRVDTAALARDIEAYGEDMGAVEAWLRKRLGAPDLNLDADQDVAAVLASSGVIDDDKWVLTKTGKRSVSKVNLKPEMYNDLEVSSAFGYRNRLTTCLNMFMRPWLAQALKTGGTIHTNWHQTRGGDGGTRTGRPATSSPNLLNLSKSFEDRSDGYIHPTHIDVAPLPLVRNYVLPDEGHVFLHRDFDGQELRVYAHYECGDLSRAYLRDPSIDPHALIKQKVFDITGKDIERTIIKNINFGKLYGAGVPRIQELMSCSLPQAKEMSALHAQAMPDLGVLQDEIKRVVRGGDPIRTWGGRCYFPEPPRFDKKRGRHMDFEYKLLNYLVQGSAADITKQSIIDWYSHPRRDPRCRLLVTVYDETNLSCPEDCVVEQMAVLREVMEKAWLDVPMLSSPKVGLTWGGAQKPKKGEAEDGFMARIMQELVV